MMTKEIKMYDMYKHLLQTNLLGIIIGSIGINNVKDQK